MAFSIGSNRRGQSNPIFPDGVSGSREQWLSEVTIIVDVKTRTPGLVLFPSSDESWQFVHMWP